MAGWGPGGYFGNWFKGDFIADDSDIGWVRDNKGRHADDRNNQRYGTFWRGQNGKVYVSGDKGVNDAGDWNDASLGYWTERGYRQIDDPNRPQGADQNGTLYRSDDRGQVVDAPPYNPFAAQEARNRADAIARYDEEIRQANTALGRLDGQYNIGVQNADKAKNRSLNDLEGNFNQEQGRYQMRTDDAIKAIRRVRDNIESDAADKIRSVRGLLASGGAGDSSFSKTLAPFMVTEAASREQEQAQDTYARNRRDMDINFTELKNAYNRKKKDIDSEHMNRLQNLKQRIESSRSDLESKIRNANINKSVASGSSLGAAIASQQATQDKINNINKEIDNLGLDKSIDVGRVEWKAPELDSYKPKEVVVDGSSNGESPGVNDQIAPNLQNLLGEEKKKKEALGW